MQLEYPIDENALFSLFLSHEENGFYAELRSRYRQESQFIHNVLPRLSLGANGLHIAFSASGGAWLPTEDQTIALFIDQTPLAHFSVHGNDVRLMNAPSPRRLSVMETRALGRAPLAQAPYPLFEGSGMLTPITDLHTHLSGQVSAKDLIALGLKHDMAYPGGMLDMLHIPYPADELVSVPKRVFLPLAHLNMTQETSEPGVRLTRLDATVRARLENAMSLTPENQATYGAMETCYYLREPFTKDVSLLPEILHCIAQEYRRQGVQYAELSSTIVFDPVWLKAIHETLPHIEKDTGVALRFKAGLPRNLDAAQLTARTEQYKRIAHSPYVVGVDVLGYEINRTSKFAEHLQDLAQWMHLHLPDGVIQIHAGENHKNPANVNEALQLALDHRIQLQLGHAIHGIDDNSLALARKLAMQGSILVQFNSDSNMALNNIDSPSDMRMGRFMEAGIPIVLGSDGMDMYRTSAQQMAMAASFGGVETAGFKLIRATEVKYIARQRDVFERKEAALPKDFFATLAVPAGVSRSKPVKPAPLPMPDIETTTRSRRPLLLAGAGGSGWNNIPPAQQKLFRQNLTLLLEKLDPQKVYFVKGRTKKTGINNELDLAVERYNLSHPSKFSCITLLAESEAPDSLGAERWPVLKLHVPLVYLPEAIIGFLRERQGIALYAGGKNFTRDFILMSADPVLGIPFGMMQDIDGASHDKALIYPEHSFQGSDGMLKYIYAHCPDVIMR